MSMCSVFSPVAGREVCKSVSLCPVSFCTPRPNLPVTPGISWLPTFAFQSSRSPCPWWWFISNLCVELGLESRAQETSWLSLENPKIPEAWAGRGCGESLILYLLPLDRWRTEAKEGDWLVKKAFHAVCGILVAGPGIEPVSPAVERWSLTIGPPGSLRAPLAGFSFPSKDWPLPRAVKES